MNRSIIFVVLALLNSACGNNPQRAQVKYHLPLASGILLESAMLEVEEATGDRFMHDPQSGYTITLRYGTLPDLTLGQALVGDDEECEITLNSKINPEEGAWTYEDLRHVALHEIGHCFGLEHDPDPQQIMYWQYLHKQNSNSAFAYYVRTLNTSRGL